MGILSPKSLFDTTEMASTTKFDKDKLETSKMSKLPDREYRGRSLSKSPNRMEYLERKVTQLQVNEHNVFENAAHVWSRTKGLSFDSASPDQPKIFLSKKTKNLVIKMPNGEIFEGECDMYFLSFSCFFSGITSEVKKDI